MKRWDIFFEGNRQKEDEKELALFHQQEENPGREQALGLGAGEGSSFCWKGASIRAAISFA